MEHAHNLNWIYDLAYIAAYTFLVYPLPTMGTIFALGFGFAYYCDRVR